MSILRQVVLRYHAAGHARFGLPGELCRTETAERLVAALRRAEGVRSVRLYRRQGKLSLRYNEDTTDFKRMTQILSERITEIVNSPPPSGERADLATPPTKPTRGSFGMRYRAFRERMTAAGAAPRNTVSGKLKLSPVNGKFASEFLTDVLVLYLIKSHWNLITQFWLKRPWQYRYEWMAAFYMVFLLVKSKKPKS